MQVQRVISRRISLSCPTMNEGTDVTSVSPRGVVLPRQVMDRVNDQIGCTESRCRHERQAHACAECIDIQFLHGLGKLRRKVHPSRSLASVIRGSSELKTQYTYQSYKRMSTQHIPPGLLWTSFEHYECRLLFSSRAERYLIAPSRFFKLNQLPQGSLHYVGFGWVHFTCVELKHLDLTDDTRKFDRENLTGVQVDINSDRHRTPDTWLTSVFDTA